MGSKGLIDRSRGEVRVVYGRVVDIMLGHSLGRLAEHGIRRGGSMLGN
jgi:hypothetical protein